MEEFKTKVENETEAKKCPVPLWKRAGYIGFWFFFIKGVTVWIIGPILLYFFGPELLDKITGFFGKIF